MSVVVVDLILPGLNAVEVIERIRRDLPRTRIVAMTGAASFAATPNQLEAQLGFATQATAVALLIKPFDLDALVSLVRGR